MAQIFEGSVAAMLPDNHLFTIPATFTDRWKTEHERINPTSVLTDGGSSGDITFYIPPSSTALLSLNDIYLELEAGIQKKTLLDPWAKITAADGVAPVNNFLHSLFQSLEVTLNGRTITDSANYYPYRAYLENLLCHTERAQKSQLTSSMFYLDTAGKMNNDTDNSGEQKRKLPFTNSEYVQLSGRLATDLFDQSKPLLTGVGMTIRLVMHRPDFFLRVWDNDQSKQFRGVVRNVRLAIRRYVPSPDYMLASTNHLQNNMVKYHLERVVMRVTDIPRGTQSTVVPNLHIGQLPKVVIIGFVESKDFHGSKATNPFNFRHCDVSQLSVEVDGQSYPNKPYVANFTNHASLECYDGLLDTLKQRHTTFGELPFDREEYEGGFTLFGFDLTPGSTGRGPLTLIKQGNLSVAVTFNSANGLAEPVMMVCMMVYDGLLEINHLRQVLMDFKP